MKILMVCLGNICRSPLAEGILQQLANNKNLNWQVASAGTGNWHIGQAPDSRSVTAANKKGHDISQQRAQQFKPTMFAYYDLIFAMDKNNFADLLSIATSKTEKSKIKMFLEIGDVTDPYYDDKLFSVVTAQIETRCEQIIKEFS
ncbi:protein-tyrosine phosphatase [Pedobacter sp. UYP30]|uniref:low molecular weight protein-tyrosine-phosphatase n=1 Tax=Pedobacter sp. UYP30 TaxID=1756400 RepID=UPI0033964F1A